MSVTVNTSGKVKTLFCNIMHSLNRLTDCSLLINESCLLEHVTTFCLPLNVTAAANNLLQIPQQLLSKCQQFQNRACFSDEFLLFMNANHQSNRQAKKKTNHDALTGQIFIHQNVIWFAWWAAEDFVVRDPCTDSLQPLPVIINKYKHTCKGKVR